MHAFAFTLSPQRMSSQNTLRKMLNFRRMITILLANQKPTINPQFSQNKNLNLKFQSLQQLK